MKELSKVVGKVTNPIYSKKGFVEGQILSNWSKIVGSEISSYSIPSKVVFNSNKRKDGTLKILVSSDKIFEIDFFKENIIERINIFFGYSAIKKISIKQFVSSLIDENINDTNKKRKIIKINKNIALKNDKAIMQRYSEDINNISDDLLRDALNNLSKLL